MAESVVRAVIEDPSTSFRQLEEIEADSEARNRVDTLADLEGDHR